MKLSEAYPICKKAVNQPFKKLFNDFSKEEIILNKGKVGQLMEKYCGLKLSNTNQDFEDGELKTSEIKESTQITMITEWIDDIIHPKDTRKKISEALDLLANKSESLPPKKHGNIPL